MTIRIDVYDRGRLQLHEREAQFDTFEDEAAFRVCLRSGRWVLTA